MKILLKLVLLVSLINTLYAKNKVLYPVYSVKLDKINIDIMKMLSVEKRQFYVKYRTFPLAPGQLFWLPNLYEYMLNLNNLLLLHNKTGDDYTYNLLGKITIDENDELQKVKYEVVGNFEKNIYQEIIEKKQFELVKNINYINRNKLTLEEIKKTLDVDFINENLGEQLYLTNRYNLSVKEATSNFINCRFCEQMMRLYDNVKIGRGCDIYSLCDYPLDYSSIYTVIFNDMLFNRGTLNPTKDSFEYFKNINEKGNIYNQLNSKYISQTYQEWEEIKNQK